NGTLQPSRFITCGVMITPYIEQVIHRGGGYPEGAARYGSCCLPSDPARFIHISSPPDIDKIW
ncbi:hypothetical protein ACPQUH_17625, partial [Klebsiella pneumoniae]